LSLLLLLGLPLLCRFVFLLGLLGYLPSTAAASPSTATRCCYDRDDEQEEQPYDS